MGPDERTIREMHSTWIEAVNAGDLVCVLSLMAATRRPLAPGPRRPYVVPRGEIERLVI